MRYWELIKGNIDKIKGDDAKMNKILELTDELLEGMSHPHPERYWQFMRDTHEVFYGKHFDREYAEWQVEQMYHKDKNGRTHRGEHWTLEQTTEVMQSYKSKLPAEVTPADFYVALNTQWHDYICWAMEHYESEDEADNAIIEMAVRFWFIDDDWGDNAKVWEYFRKKNK